MSTFGEKVRYLRELEELSDKDSLFSKILERWKEKEIREIIFFFYSDKSIHFENRLKKRVLDFWQFCFLKLGKKIEFNQNDKKILSDFNLLACFMDKIGEKKKWLLQSIPYIAINYNSPEFIKCLDKLVDNNPQEVIELYLSMLNYHVPTYDEEKIKSILKKLNEKGESQGAKKIIDKYLTLGYESFRNAIKG